MKIHSKYRQKKTRMKAEHLRQYFLINLCVKPLVKRTKQELAGQEHLEVEYNKGSLCKKY